MPNIYHHSARLSIAIGVACNIGAILFTAIHLYRVHPDQPDFIKGYFPGIAIISGFSALIGGTTAVVGWIDPASSPLAKRAFLLALTPFFAGLLTLLIPALLTRLISHS